MSEPEEVEWKRNFVHQKTYNTTIKRDEANYPYAHIPCKMTEEKYDIVVRDLAKLINHHSLENGSNTADFILAEYMLNALFAFEAASKYREKWYGKSLSINGGDHDD